MTFPITLDQPELQRLIRDISRIVVKEVDPTKKPLMKKTDAYALVGKELVDRAIKLGDLKQCIISGSLRIRRKDFENWIEKAKKL